MGDQFAVAVTSRLIAEDRSRAITWVIQYLNHLQIVYDLHHVGALDEVRYKLWEGFAISMVASKGPRGWWDEEQRKSGFMPEIQNLFGQRLNNKNDPPTPFNEMWSIFNAQSWSSNS